MVSRTGVPRREIVETKGFDVFHPSFEEGEGGVIPLKVDTAEASGTIVHIEVEGEFVESGEFLLILEQVLLKISPGTIKTLFLTTPEGKTDSSLGFDSQIVEDTHGFCHDYAS